MTKKLDTPISRLPDPGHYARAWRRVLASDPVTMFDTGWPRGKVDRDTLLREFREALDRRITSRGGIARGRKHDPLYQLEIKRDALDLDRNLTQRVRIYRFRCKEMNERFAHRLAQFDD